MNEGIAVIGMAGKFPKANSVREFWSNLLEGKDAVQFFSDAELEASISADIINSPNFLKAGYVVDNAEYFDADFFKMSNRQAAYTDPQQRLFLECAWEALEDAGYCSSDAMPRTGVFASAAMSTYVLNLEHDCTPSVPEKFFEVMLGNDKDYLASRVCYKMNLKGPGVVVQSACSSSLVAVAMACKSLSEGESDMVLAGGVSLNIPQRHGFLIESEGFLAPDAVCRAFDKGASGTVQGNGLGIVVLKRLNDALRDNDTPYAVIRGYGVNNDGSAKIGFTAPSFDGQSLSIRRALEMSGFSPDSISYVETHGTGTAIGDPIEIAALSKAYGNERAEFCSIGSVKTNIGHLNAAAGIASLIKVCLALKNRLLPASLHFDQPNPKIDFAKNGFAVNAALTTWSGKPLRAGVSSFGFGGTNCHVILEEAEKNKANPGVRPWNLLILSAKTPTALASSTRRLAEHLKRSPELCLADVAYTLQVGRCAFAWKQCIICADMDDAIRLLSDTTQDRVLNSPAAVSNSPVPPAFYFPGEGWQPGFGSGLYAREPVFAASINRLAKHLSRLIGFDFLTWMLRGSSDERQYPDTSKSTKSSLALFIVETALTELWASWGVFPGKLLASGVGKFAAGCLAGIFSPEEALELMTRTNAGAKKACDGQRLRSPRLKLFCADTGCWTDRADSLEYWQSLSLFPVNSPVGGQAAIDRTPVLEVGPRSSRSGLVLFGKDAPETAGMISGLQGDAEEENPAMLMALGKLWLAGAEIKWAKGMYANSGCGRVSLPSYPFERRRFYIERKPLENNLTAEAIGKKDFDNWFYHPTWKRLPPLASTPSPSGMPRSWLIFIDEYGIGESMAHALRLTGNMVTTASAGDSFAITGEDAYTIMPGNQGDYLSLLSRLQRSGRMPNKIAHMWGVGPEYPAADDYVLFEKNKMLGYDSLLAFARAWADVAHSGQLVTLGVFFTGVLAVSGDETINPEKALTLGPCRVIPNELPSVRCLHADVQFPKDAAGKKLLALRSIQELNAAESSSSFPIAFRGNYRWRQQLDPRLLPLPDSVAIPLRKQGTYIVTGGLGGVGMAIARFLAAEYQAKLVLLGRKQLPPPEEYDAWLKTHPEDDAVSISIRAVRDLEKEGSEVMAVAANVSDPVAMGKAVLFAEQAFGKVHGVFHAAGLATGGLIHGQTPSGRSSNFEPKVYGTIVLERIFADKEPDFILFFSSLNAFGGVQGSVDYTAANCFMDAVANACHLAGNNRVRSINWDFWSGLGMARQLPASSVHTKSGLQPEEGIEALKRVLAARDEPQICICATDVDTFLLQARNVVAPNRPTPGNHPATFARPTLNTEYKPPASPVEHVICSIWRDILGVAEVGAQDRFLDLGGDSLLAMTLNTRVKNIFFIKLPLNAVFTHDTASKFATLLARYENEPGMVDKIASAYLAVKGMSSEEVAMKLRNENTQKKSV